MKIFTAKLLINENCLRQAYMSSRRITKSDCPSLEKMIEAELNWVFDSGISQIGDPIEQKYSYQQLQQMAKHYGIKANLKREDLEAALDNILRQ